jgi:hypothetical protein
VDDGTVLVTCPWGNRLRCHAPGPGFGDRTLGIGYVEFPVERGTADGIAAFYRTVMGAPAATARERGEAVARVTVGPAQRLVFRETAAPLAAYDGHHIAIYTSDFAGPYERLRAHGLVSEESGQYQYRFLDIADPESWRPLFRIEHEVRCVTHPMYLRPLVNRNPAQRQPTYQRGCDAFVPGMA